MPHPNPTPKTIRIFDLALGLPEALARTPGARRRLEAEAREKMRRQLDDKGYRLLADTFRVVWITPYQGRATAAGSFEPKGEEQ